MSMHTKPILAITVIAVFVIGVVSFDDAFAKKVSEPLEVGDQLKLQGKGNGECTFGEDSGNVQTKFTSIFRIDEVNDGDLNGLAKAQIRLNSTCDGIPKELVNDGPLIFSYDAGDEELSVSGDMKAKDGTMFSLEGYGSGGIIDNSKTSIDIVLNIGGQEGEEFTVETTVNVQKLATDETSR